MSNSKVQPKTTPEPRIIEHPCGEWQLQFMDGNLIRWSNYKTKEEAEVFLKAIGHE